MSKLKASVQAKDKEEFDKVFAKLETVKARLEQKSRVRYLIINLMERRRQRWPDNKAQTEGPKTIQQIHEDMDKEQLGPAKPYPGARPYHDDYPRDDEDSHQPQPQSPIRYVKKKPQENKFAALADAAKEEDAEKSPQAHAAEPSTKLDAEELAIKVKEHMQKYQQDPATDFAAITSIKETGNPVNDILQAVILSAFAQPDSRKDPNKTIQFCTMYIASYCKSGICTPPEIVAAIVKYLHTTYEQDCEDNLHVRSLLVRLLSDAVLVDHCDLKSVQLMPPGQEAEDSKGEIGTTVKGRLELGCTLLLELKAKNAPPPMLQSFWTDVVLPLSKKADAFDVNEEMLTAAKQACVVEESFVDEYAAVLQRGRERKFSESFQEHLVKQGDFTSARQTAFGQALFRVIYQDTNPKVYH